LSNLRILALQAKAEDLAVNATRRAVTATTNAYLAGTVAYTNVVTEQTSLLGNQQTALGIQQSRLVASVALVQALGGGWTTADLPKDGEIGKAFNPLVP
jgi:outer membrane protein TolC